MAKTWFEFKNASETDVEVSIYDVIGLWGVSAKSFTDELKKHSGKKLTVRINSPGGSVVDGYAIFNALKRHKGGLRVQIDALAASMATYIALAGAPIRMAENGFFMIHNVSGLAYGTADEMRKAADVAEKMQKNIVAAYVAKTGKSAEEIEEKMDEETWFSADEAKEFGFVDEVTDRIEAAACLSKEAFDVVARFKNAPAGFVDSTAPRNGGPKGEPAQIKENTSMKAITAAVAALLSTLTGAALTEASTEADVKAALDAQAKKVSDLEAAKKSVDEQLAAVNVDKVALQGKLTTAEAEVKKLTGEAKTADQKAQEIAAAHGSAGATKPPETAQGNGEKSGKELFEAYQKLGGREASAFWKQHEKALMAYAEAEEAKARRRDQE